MKEVRKAVLLLEDGTVFEGIAMGALGKQIGTVVFNTAMVGYQEALTTPANRGLLLTQTFPLIGNYGINEICWESDRVHATGYIVREICEKPSNYLCKGTLQDFLAEKHVVGISGIDTRHLTKIIREKGEMKGMILSDAPFQLEACLAELRDFIPQTELATSPCSTSTTDAEASPNLQVAVLDLGLTNSMRKALTSRNINLHCYSDVASIQQLAASLSDASRASTKPDGIFLSDGSGNPEDFPQIIEAVRALCHTGIPILGVSLGHQILALANGMTVRRLKHGHRGANQPVASKNDGRTYITTQNHGYVVENVDPTVCDLTFTNANDHTCEGLSYRSIPALSVQFLPDGENHTHSTAFLWDEFVQLMKDHHNA